MQVKTRGGKSIRQSTRKSTACDSAQASHERAHNDTQVLTQQSAHVTQSSIEPNIGISGKY